MILAADNMRHTKEVIINGNGEVHQRIDKNFGTAGMLDGGENTHCGKITNSRVRVSDIGFDPHGDLSLLIFSGKHVVEPAEIFLHAEVAAGTRLLLQLFLTELIVVTGTHVGTAKFD